MERDMTWLEFKEESILLAGDILMRYEEHPEWVYAAFAAAANRIVRCLREGLDPLPAHDDPESDTLEDRATVVLVGLLI